MVFIILFALCRKGSAKNILFLMNPLVESQRPLRLCEKRNNARGRVSLSRQATKDAIFSKRLG